MIKRAIILIAMLASGFALAQQPVDNAPIFQFNQQADASALDAEREVDGVRAAYSVHKAVLRHFAPI